MRPVRIGLAVLGLVACGRDIAPAALRVDVTTCQPVRFGMVIGASLRHDAPSLDDGARYQCLVFPGDAAQRVQLTVFADGFRPVIYLLEPGRAPHRLLAREVGHAVGGVARAAAVLPRTTPYAAVVTAEPGAQGSFVFSVQDAP